MFVLKLLSLCCTNLRLGAFAIVDLAVSYTYCKVDKISSMAGENHVGNLMMMYLACREPLEIRAQVEDRPILVADAVRSNPLLSICSVRECAFVMIVCSMRPLNSLRSMICPDQMVKNSFILVGHI